MTASVLVVADIAGSTQGFVDGFAGSLTPKTLGGFACGALATADTIPGNVGATWAGDVVSQVSGKNLTIEGVEYTVSVDAVYDSGQGTTSMQWAYALAPFTIGNSYDIELDAAGGGDTVAVDLGEWRGDAVAILPGTTWAAPNGMFSGTATRNDNTAYSFNSSTSTITLPSTDLADGYLVIGAFEFEDDSNGRCNPQARIIQTSGTGNFAGGASSGYNRDASEDRSYVRVWAFVDSPSAAAEFQFQWRRDTDAPTGGTERTQLQIIPLFYANHGVYSSASNACPGGITPNQVTGFSAVDESDTSAIQLVSNVVSVKGDNKRYLVLGGQYWQGIGNARSQRWHGLRVDGAVDRTTQAYSYARNAANADIGDMFTTVVATATADRTIDQFVYRGDALGSFPQTGADVDGNTTGSNASHAMVVLELHDNAEVFLSHSTTQQDIDAAGQRINLQIADVLDENDSASFTKESATAINAEQDGDFLLGSNVSGGYATDSTARYTGYAEFTKNGAGENYSFAGDYGRGNQGTQDTWGWSANLMGFVAAAANDNLGVNAGKITGGEGGTVDTMAGWVGFWGVNLQTLPEQTSAGTNGSSSITLATLGGSSDSSLAIDGTGSNALVAASVSAISTLSIDGSASIALAAATLVSAAESAPEAIAASLDVNLGSIGVSSESTVAISAQSIVQLAGVSAASAASLSLVSDADNTLAACSVSAVGSTAIRGAASFNLEPVQATSNASNEIGAEAGVTLGECSISGSGSLSVEASANMSLSPLSAASSGSQLTGGDLNASLSALSIASVGQLPMAAIAALQLGPLFTESAGSLKFEAVGNGNLAALTVASTGNLIEQRAGELSATLGALTGGADASLALSAQSAGHLSALTMDAAAELDNSSSAVLIGALAPLEMVSSGISEIRSSANVVFGDLTTQSSGSLLTSGASANELSPLTTQSAATVKIGGTVTISLSAITLSSGASAIVYPATDVRVSGSVANDRYASETQAERMANATAVSRTGSQALVSRSANSPSSKRTA